MPPRVSVIVPAYDAPEFLAEALASVAAQDFDDYEVIVIDDGSPRDLRGAAESVGLGERLRFVRQPNAGGSAARNHGIALARGELLAFLDHDDRWLPAKLGRQVAEFDAHPDAGMVFCRFSKFGRRTSTLGYPPSAPSGRLLPALLRSTLIRTLSVVMIRRDALPGAAWFRTDLSCGNDVELYYRIAERHPIRFVDAVLTEKREHESNVSRDTLVLHTEALRIAEELAERIGADATPEVRRLLRHRIAHHHLGAARSSDDPRLAATHYRAALRSPSLRFRALLGWLRLSLASRRVTRQR